MTAVSIREGDRGPAVRDVQRRVARWARRRDDAAEDLAQAASPSARSSLPPGRKLDPPAEDLAGLVADGAFGPRTRAAVRTFQRHRGLPADGIVGAETWRVLVEAGQALGDRLLWRSGRMMRGDDIRDLQERLNRLGFDAAAEDGIFGPLAHAAVVEFQRNAGLVADGVAGPVTVAALRLLHRDFQSHGLAVRAREREGLRRLAARGLTGARILVDPAHGPAAPGITVAGVSEAEVAWALATRLAARLSALGTHAPLSRGPGSTPAPADRATLANRLDVDLVLTLGTNAHASPDACGASSYYFGSGRSLSEAGLRLAHLAQDTLLEQGWEPDCRVHPTTWTILLETRMPAAVVLPGFLTAPRDRARLTDPAALDRLAGALARALRAFVEHTVDTAADDPAPALIPA